MELKTVLPWGVLVGTYFVLLYVLAPIDHNFAVIAPGIVIIGTIYLSINQIRKYFKERRIHKFKQAI